MADDANGFPIKTPMHDKFLDLLVDFRYKLEMVINKTTIKLEAYDKTNPTVIAETVEIPFNQMIYDIIIAEMPPEFIKDFRKLN